MTPESSVADAFIDALVRRDFDALEATLDPAVQFRALVPGENVSVTSAADAVACYRRWFGDKTDVEILDRQVQRLVDTWHLSFRARLKKKEQPHVVAQSLYGIVEDGRFATLDLACSGFRPEPTVPAHDTTHVFDAGDLGCSSGLPREFRTRMSQIPVGHVLEVVTGDASAREDLPSMARLLGHEVRSVERDPQGRTRIRVERTR
jgi:TusA-related sulfurtransferase